LKVCLSDIVLQRTAHHRPGKAWSGPSGRKGCCWSLSSLIFGFNDVMFEMAALFFALLD
jgi:hypothetical protein